VSAGPRHGLLASRTLVRGGVWVLGAALGLVLGCPFELQRGLSCGDGWWDPEFEECDPKDPDAPYLEACREQGFAEDAKCDPQTCTVRASEADCNRCGDGRAAGDEQCDGQDLGGQTCAGVLSCTDNCQLDYSACEAFCGDEVVLGDEECEFGVDGGGFKNLSCSDYESTAIGLDKPYASGTVGSCNKDVCTFGRNDCSFCGDGELDPEYIDYIAPQGTAEFPAEICDGNEAQPGVLEDHCEALCVDDAINGDVVVFCDFECADDCSGIAPPGDIIPAPEAIGCCVAKDAPCPKFDIEGVPDLPCCSWLKNPEWLAEEKCVVAETNTIPITFICP
jgi:hypothetical protein